MEILANDLVSVWFCHRLFLLRARRRKRRLYTKYRGETFAFDFNDFNDLVMVLSLLSPGYFRHYFRQTLQALNGESNFFSESNFRSTFAIKNHPIPPVTRYPLM